MRLVTPLQAKLSASFIPSDELAVEGRRIKEQQAEQRQGQTGLVGPSTGLSEGEQRVYTLLVGQCDVAALYRSLVMLMCFREAVD